MLFRIRECGTTQEQKKVEKPPEQRQTIPMSEFKIDWNAIYRGIEADRREQQLLRDAPFSVDNVGDYPWMQWEIDGGERS